MARIVGWFRLLALLVVALLAASVIWALVLRVANPPATLTMISRDLGGAEITQEWTPLTRVSPHLIRAVIAAEDGQFCRHYGFDLGAIREALEERQNGARLRGASTISQQTAKNVFLWNGGGWPRKGLEAWMTLVIETLWPKTRILEVYLNVAEWGEGNFGAEAAAQAYFGKSARRLSAREAALLASVLPSPNKWRADRPGPYVRRRAATVAKRVQIVRREGLDRCVLNN